MDKGVVVAGKDLLSLADIRDETIGGLPAVDRTYRRVQLSDRGN